MSRALVAAAALMIMGGGPVAFTSNVAASPIDEAVQTATSIGRAVGAATVCAEIPRASVKAVTDQFNETLRQFTSNKQTAQVIQDGYDQGMTLGQKAVGASPIECFNARRELSSWDAPRLRQLAAD